MQSDQQFQNEQKFKTDVTHGYAILMGTLDLISSKYDFNTAHKAFITTFIDYLAREKDEHLELFVQLFNEHRQLLLKTDRDAVKGIGELLFAKGLA